jgi:hypothetical protein
MAESPFENADKVIKQITSKQTAVITRKLARVTEEIRFSDMPLILAEMSLFTFIGSDFDAENFVSRLENLETRLTDDSIKSDRTSDAQVKKKEVKLTEEKIPPQNTPLSCTHTRQKTGDVVVWKKLLDCFDRENPILHQILSNSSFQAESDKSWTLSVLDNFAKNTLEKNKTKIIQTINSISGRKLNLKFKVAPVRVKSYIEEVTVTEDAKISDEKPLAENPAWQDIGSDKKIDTSVKNVLKHIEGEIVG